MAETTSVPESETPGSPVPPASPGSLPSSTPGNRPCPEAPQILGGGELTRAVGMPIEELDTPALLLDVVASDRNIKRMASYFGDKKCKLRPHFKNHKCTTLARRQLVAGSAVGLTCAKLGEAEILAGHGFDDILIANQVVGAGKLQRLAELAGRAKVAVAVDHATQAQAISQAAASRGVTVGILVEVDIGMGRCGIAPGAPTLDLARQVTLLPGLRFEGLQAFEGHLVYVNDLQERSRRTRESMRLAVQTRRLLEDEGIEVHVISGGSTATYSITGSTEGIDELQAGTYPTMDWRYHEVVPEFEVALTVLASVISRPRPGCAVLDFGVKGAGGEFGPPQISGHPEIEIPFFLAEEHLVITNTPDWKVGQTLHVQTSHACTTCNLYRQLHVHEQGRVVDVWPIEASGRLS